MNWTMFGCLEGQETRCKTRESRTRQRQQACQARRGTRRNTVSRHSPHADHHSSLRLQLMHCCIWQFKRVGLLRCACGQEQQGQCSSSWRHETTGQCLPCRATGCDTCSPDTPDVCDGCTVGYRWDEAAQVCTPCAVGCSICDRYAGQQCERCFDGFNLERDSRLCKPVSWHGWRGRARGCPAIAM